MAEGKEEFESMDYAPEGLAEFEKFDATGAVAPNVNLPSPVITESQDMEWGDGYGAGLAGSVANGIFANFGDELVGGLNSGIAHGLQGIENITGLDVGDVPKGESLGDTYLKMRDIIRGTNNEFQKKHPGMSAVGNVAGALAPISKGINAISSIKGMMTVGGGYGLADYLGRLEQLDQGTPIGALGSTALGAAIPGAIGTVGQLVKFLRNMPEDKAGALLKKIVEKSGKSIEDIDPTIGTSVAAQVGPSGAKTVAHAIKNEPGVEQIVRSNISGTPPPRQGLVNVMEESTGKGDLSYYKTLQELKDAKKAASEANYGEAMKVTVQPTIRMQEILQSNPLVRNAWEAVQKQYKKDGIELPELWNAAGKKTDWPTSEALQRMKWEMDRMIRLRSKSTDPKYLDEAQRLMSDKKALMNEIYTQNPLLREADDTFAGNAALETAQELGKKHGLGSDKIDDQLEYIRTLNTSEKDAYLQGVMSKEFGRLGMASEDVLGNINRLNSQNASRVLDELAPGASESIKREIAKQQSVVSTNKSITKSLDDVIADIIPAGKHKTIGDVVPHRTDAIGWIRKFKPTAFLKNENEMLRIADMLTDPNKVNDAIEAMNKAGFKQSEIGSIVKNISTGQLATSTGAQHYITNPAFYEE